MTWAYLFTEGTTKHPIEHKHTHAYSVGIVLLHFSIDKIGRFSVKCNSKAIKSIIAATGCRLFKKQ